MKTIAALYIFLLGFSPLFIVAQETWSLERCIDYADSSNLNLQNKKIDLLIAEIQQKQAKLNILPSLNMGGTHGFNWGQSLDPFTNQFATDRIRTNNLYAGSNWNIFSGLKNYYLQQQNNLTYQATEQEIQIAKRNLEIEITSAYMQVVLNQYLIEAAENKVEYALGAKNITKERFDLGYVTHFELLSMESQLSIDSATLIQAKNNKEYSLLLLSQLLNLEELISIDIPSIDRLAVGAIDVDKSNFSNNPEFDLSEIQKNIQVSRIKVAKSQLLPTISINSSIGSGYSGNNKEMIGNEFQPKPFEVQIQENFYQSSVMTLSVPIFNKGRVRSEVKIAEAELAKIKINQEIMFQDLNNKLEQLENEINNEMVNANALERALTASKERYKAATEQFNAGSLNVQNYIELRNTLFKTQSEYYTSLITLKFKQEMFSFLY